MERGTFLGLLGRNLNALDEWAAQWEPFEPDMTLQISPTLVEKTMNDLTDRLRENYPYQHPRYVGQMLKPPHPVAMLAYMTAMQINPNNHALDGGIATSRMEREVVADLARMFGFPEVSLGHLSASGTIANLEALWIARCLHPEKAVVISDQAHYTHKRACEVLQVPCLEVGSDAEGRIDLAELQELLNSEIVGTVVATAGTTGLGAVDHLHDIRSMTRAAGARMHVDAAYGGFFRLLADREDLGMPGAAFRAMDQADSIVIDPHKHGLQPYGCGAVLFRDPGVGQFYQHDSPYTYFTSDDLHLGEITLECSRAGASAAALWATLRCLPLETDRGLGPILARCRQAAMRWADELREHPRFRLVCEPELDIINYYAAPPGDYVTASGISELSKRLFQVAEDDRSEPLYLATLRVEQHQLEARASEIEWDQPTVTVLRSVVMKPEHYDWIPRIHTSLERHLETVSPS